MRGNTALDRRWVRYGLLVLVTGVGAALGATYSLTIGCVTGGCPITANPWLMGAMGGLLAFTLSADLVGRRASVSGGAPEATQPDPGQGGPGAAGKQAPDQGRA